ncbi:MAG: type II toxin-antitoxin system antitoxin, RelB/DinJ family [Rickettsiales bacterium]|nr:MAG: type II toxin-antitoxin system antitoxin, RelB/DinJ family [Rickettsiales bacterium]
MSNMEVRLRVGSKLKKNADSIFQEMGMTMSEAIRIFLTQAVNSGGLPFRPHLTNPNSTTIQAFEDVDSGDFEEMSIEKFSNYLDGIEGEKSKNS